MPAQGKASQQSQEATCQAATVVACCCNVMLVHALWLHGCSCGRRVELAVNQEPASLGPAMTWPLSSHGTDALFCCELRGRSMSVVRNVANAAGKALQFSWCRGSWQSD
jgi:hypothetical protein